MACGCGGGNGGGCSGEQNDSGVIQQAVAEEVRAAAVEFVDAAPELIASSEQEWPRIKVNGVALEAESIARELQYHPAPNRQEAVFLPARRWLFANCCSSASRRLACRSLHTPASRPKKRPFVP